VSDVARCRTTLSGLRRIYEEQHTIVAMTREELLAKAEQQERAQMAPEGVLRSALARQNNCKREVERGEPIARDFKSELDDMSIKLAAASQQLVAVNAEVAQARLALEPATSSGLVEAANEIASLQQILQGARGSTSAGHDHNMVGGTILDTLADHINRLGAAVPP
ncbi:unnamed protein product, partial [Prorocentrum cordatum]